jgi:hypothetical protein
MRTILALSLGVVLCAAAQAAAGQSLPALPSGFQADPGNAAISAADSSGGLRGTKANDSMSPCFGDPKIIFGYGWILNPAAKMMVDMMLKAPQDPATTSSQTGVLDEPVSKQAYKNGVLEWRKQTWPVITGHPCKDSHVIFYSGKWTGYSGDKMIGVSVDRLYNSKDQGQGWIDEYITKLAGVGNSN